MPNFSYQAISQSGNTVSGFIEAESLEAAKNALADQGYIPSKVKAIEGGSKGESQGGMMEALTRVKVTDLILFSKQFRTLTRAGVPIVDLFQVLESQTENVKLKKIIGSIGLSVRSGSTLHDAFRRHPRVFSPLYCSMIRAGEMSGSLPAVLDRLIYIIEHESKIKADIKSALQYPITVVVFLSIAFVVLLTFAVPRFAQIFLKAGVQLPWPTRICVSLYHFLFNYWYLVLGVIVIGIGFLIYQLKRREGKYYRDVFLLRLPVFGPLFVKAAMSRFSSIFAILHESGIQVIDSMRILCSTVGNMAISKELERAREKVEKGQGISEPLKSARYFPPMVVGMVALGEGSGRLEEMLREISKHYDDEVDYAIKRLSDTIGPVLIVGLAAVVGFFALAIFLPMWDLSKVMLKG